MLSFWHKSKKLEIPENFERIFIPPYTPEMNPIEQIWTELRKSFANKQFATLHHVLEQLHQAVFDLSNETVQSIGRKWLLDLFQI